ncbi:MAG TPA: MauE/DoxX family redox-associated membrane protein [Candidatus Saccharimonadales bacterium]|nr:MauE/DoxX family redox-associated membrane protein [Candidatus Saccharimonadales bacterium]
MMQSSPFNYRRAIILIGRLLLGALFVYAGYAKIFLPNFIPSPMFALRFSILTNLSNFAMQVESYELLSRGGASFVAHTLPFAEIILGLLLLIGWQVRLWASLITLLLLGFVVVVSRAYALHMNINCGCFATPEPLTGYTVLRDAALTVFALVVTVLAFLEARAPHPWTAPRQS